MLAVDVYVPVVQSETRADSARRSWADPDIRAQRSEGIKKAWTPERRAAQGKRSREMWSGGHRAVVIASLMVEKACPCCGRTFTGHVNAKYAPECKREVYRQRRNARHAQSARDGWAERRRVEAAEQGLKICACGCDATFKPDARGIRKYASESCRPSAYASAPRPALVALDDMAARILADQVRKRALIREATEDLADKREAWAAKQEEIARLDFERRRRIA